MVRQKHHAVAYLGICLFIVLGFFKSGHELGQHGSDLLFGGSRSSSSLSSPPYSNNDDDKNKQRNLTKNIKNVYYYNNGTQPLVNRWYGWQPKIKAMECSWKVCFKNRHSCKTCRDSLEDLNNVTNNSSSLIDDPGKDWIPDVTMLRRMYEDGHDANGIPWPPPLDDNLCTVLENDDYRKTKELLDVVPIVSDPIPRTPETNNNNKVLCMIYTMEKAHHKSIRAMRETWAPGCDGFLAFSTKTDPRIPAINIPHRGPEKYGNMWQKVRSIWAFVGKHYLSDFDWFYIGGDDLIVFPQNLKKFLGTYNSSEPHFLGRRFQPKDLAFNTGGAGYALSRPSLACLVANLRNPRCKFRKQSSEEDVLTAACLKYACKIKVEDTRDAQKRERFHHFDPGAEYTYKGGKPWYNMYTKKVGGILRGKKCCAPDTISFHYVKKPAMMRYLHHYVHNCNRSI